MKKNYIIILTVLLLAVGILSDCGHKHIWIDATCTEPKTCSECGKTRGKALEHTWVAATCTEPKTCSECGKTRGKALEHTWVAATCTEPRTCSECGKTEGTALEHTWVAATCMKPRTCSECGKTEGTTRAHTLDYSHGKCKVCGKQAVVLDELNYERYLDVDVSDSPYINTDIFGEVQSRGCYIDIKPKGKATFFNVEVTVKVGFTNSRNIGTIQPIVVTVNNDGYGKKEHCEDKMIYDSGVYKGGEVSKVEGYVIAEEGTTKSDEDVTEVSDKEVTEVSDVIVTMFTNDSDKIKYSKYYPDELAKAMEEAVAEYGNNPALYEKDDIKIVNITKVKTSELEDMKVHVMVYVMDVARFSNVNLEDVEVSAGYRVEVKVDNTKVEHLVLEVNGRYGLY